MLFWEQSGISLSLCLNAWAVDDELVLGGPVHLLMATSKSELKLYMVHKVILTTSAPLEQKYIAIYWWNNRYNKDHSAVRLVPKIQQVLSPATYTDLKVGAKCVEFFSYIYIYTILLQRNMKWPIKHYIIN